jgi:beta-glucosidase-like glycosyl hydrolase
MNQDEARRLIGQVFTARFPQSWSQVDLEHTPIANYIVFRDVLGPSLEASRRRMLEAKRILGSYAIEPLLMMDEEGGRVTQMSRFFASVPSPRAVAGSLTPAEAGRLYGQLAAYVAALGIDLNLAPCVDVNTERLNPIIGTRSFGKSPRTVMAYAGPAIHAMRAHLGCVAKHFPGHGMTSLDSHLALPVVDHHRDALEATHIAPFRDARELGADGIMVSHCHYRALQSDGLPASLSGQIVNDYLRKVLGFNGVVLTDSLDMLAVTGAVPADRAALLAIDAGCDILLYTEYSERFVLAFDTLVSALVEGTLREEQVRRAAARRNGLISRLRSRALRAGAAAFDEGAYGKLLETVRAKALKVSPRRGKLPVASRRVSLVSTSAATAEKMRKHIPDISLLPIASKVPGSTLILWLMEPLVLKQPLDALRAMIGRAETSVLVTTYASLADELGATDVRIISDDTSEYTEDRIIKLLFEGGHARA